MLRNGTIYTFFKALALGLLIVCNGYVLSFILSIGKDINEDKPICVQEECLPNSDSSFFGFDPKNYYFEKSKILSGQSLSQILNLYSIPPQQSQKIIKSVSELYDLKNIKAGNTYAYVSSNVCQHPDYFIYEVNANQYIVCQTRGDNCAELHERFTELKREHAFGVIETSLWNALESQNLSLDLIDQMEDALSSSVDFHHVQKGNTFKLLFDRVYIEGKATQNGQLIAAYFDTNEKENFSISFQPANKKGFYDLNGRPMESKFLKAPVRFSRISSGFNMRRFHPVLKYSRPHLGTDYAAPYGTPIMSVGSGTVSAASYSGGNGNYVKIRHDNTYETQYLHMSRFANGIRKGAHVGQGQIIGYVGSTGLATGPHVCFRFWKNGIQVNHRNLRFPSPDPMPANQLPDFYKFRDQVVKTFNSIQFSTAMNMNKNS